MPASTAPCPAETLQPQASTAQPISLCCPAAKLRLAVVVQYLPLPAVGGYLSYVGYFCFASGLGLGCGIQLDSIASWAQLCDKQVRRALTA
jgi:SulP family sulfate permease